ncbi:MAG: hypothetical protein DME69_09530 [Verrucomicrobia bacterium]|nr:MAG: hypothetical protein DME69_09530 [Verrucomicrobiota bacterium]
MRLYIGPCGLGLGHITRCDAIAREFSNEGVDVLFSSYLDALDYLKRSGFTYFSAIPLSFRTREDGTIDPKMTMTQNGVTVGLWGFIRQLIGEVRQISAFKPHVVISDTRISTLIAAFILRKPRILILNQYSVQMPKDNRKHRFADRPALFAGKIIWKYISAMLELAWGLSDLIIVPDLKAPYTISRYNLAIPPGIRRKVRLVGPLTPPKLKPPSIARSVGGSMPLVFACVSGPATDRKRSHHCPRSQGPLHNFKVQSGDSPWDQEESPASGAINAFQAQHSKRDPTFKYCQASSLRVR